MNALYYLLVFMIAMLTFGLQEFMPAIDFAQQARVLLPPVFFFSSALSVSFPVMLFLALFTGLTWDARHLPYKPEKVQHVESRELHLDSEFGAEVKDNSASRLPIGYSIILFGVAGTLMQGIRPLFKRGRWELPVFMVGVATFVWLLIEYLLMSFLRGSFEFSPDLWTKLVTNSLLAMLVSPLLLFLLHTLARICRYEVRNENLVYRMYGS